jgi:hypothetical protein
VPKTTPCHGTAGFDQGDVHGPVVSVLGILPRAVQRIDDPHPGRLRPCPAPGFVGGRLLRQHGVAGSSTAQLGHQPLVAGAVTFGLEL